MKYEKFSISKKSYKVNEFWEKQRKSLLRPGGERRKGRSLEDKKKRIPSTSAKTVRTTIPSGK